MTQVHDDEDGLPELSNRKMLGILMQEIADVRGELKDDIYELKKELKGDMYEVKDHCIRLDGKIDAVAADLRLLRYEVRQNQNHLDKRVTLLESTK